MTFNLTLWIKLIAGATDADADSEIVEDCGTDATTNNQYVFERIHSANKKLKRPAKRRTISNKLGSDQTYSTANMNDHFSSYDKNFDAIINDKQTATTASTQLDIHFMWIFLRDLLTSLVSTNDNETNDNTDNNFEMNTSSSECDYLDDSNYLTIIDGDLNEDEYFEKHKLLRQKLLGNFYRIFYTQNQIKSNKILPQTKNQN